ncbi:MAG: hypothetical protein QGD89_08325 [Actinomycetota bacterium]|nr:hypothetical protein [Actinomycetota bacterium]
MTHREAGAIRTRKLLIALVAAVAVVGTACTSNAAEQTTTTSTTVTFNATEIPNLEFGSGEVPFTVPSGFPIPGVAVVGTTMIDGVNGRTEMIINFPASVLDVAAFYEANLPVLGFEVTDSRGTDTEWDIRYVRDGIEGTIHLVFGGSSLSSGTFTFDHS